MRKPTVTATEARVRFGELMRRVMEGQEPIVVEKGGRPMVVVMSMEHYEKLETARQQRPAKEALKRLATLRADVERRLKGEPLPDLVEVISYL